MLFYRLIIAPTAIMLLPVLSLFSRKLRAGLSLRIHQGKIPKFENRPIWIHAASGEFEYAKALIRELKARRPEIPIAVTYFSPTYVQAIKKSELVDFCHPLPLDLPGPCRSFVKSLNPRQLLIARTDLWPELLSQVARLGIPKTVFSYTQKKPKNFFQKILTRWRLSFVDAIYCVSETDRRELETLGFVAEVIGDTRYDQVHHRLTHPKSLPEHLKPTKPTLILGSGWEADEGVVIEALSPLLKAKRLKLILVPHEPTPQHITHLKKRLTRADLSFALYSTGENWDSKTTLIVDQVGILAELYTWADFAVIGGSFKSSVHSVMEALGAGLVTYVGPFHANNREAVEFQQVMIHDNQSVTCVQNAQELRCKIEGWIDNEHALRLHQQGVKQEFLRRLGASAQLCNKIAQ